MNNSHNLYERALKVIPGGVNSPVRAFKAVGGSPVFIKRAQGNKLYDADNKEYIDYISSWGPMILGHSHPEIVESLKSTLEDGLSFGTPNPYEVDLAEMIVQRLDSVEMIRFVNSGTEATMSAIRLARAVTEREIVVKFSGGYHGHADSFLIQAGSGAVTFGNPDSPGVTSGSAKDTRSARYNDLKALQELFEQEGQNIAAIIIEPVSGNMGVIPPEEGFLSGIRNLCDQYGSLLIFDEVMTGFRVHKSGAQGLYGIKPDLSTFGKIIGGGLPVGAYGGSAALMQNISPAGPVYQAGTLSGNPLAMKAGIETLSRLDDSLYSRLETLSARLEKGLIEAGKRNGIDLVIQRVASMLTLFFTNKTVKNFEDAKSADHQRFARFFQLMLEEGIHLPPSGFEAWFVSAAHTEEDIEQTIKSADRCLKKLIS